MRCIVSGTDITISVGEVQRTYHITLYPNIRDSKVGGFQTEDLRTYGEHMHFPCTGMTLSKFDLLGMLSSLKSRLLWLH